MRIKVWNNFSKRKNETLRPNGGTPIDVQLKDNCSIENPIFLLSSGGGMPEYTYVEAFGHYYFVADVVNVNGSMCEIHCKQDSLATYKSEIGATSAFILYDTTPNAEIADERLAVESTPSVMQNSVTCFSDYSKSGTLVLTVAADDGTDVYMVNPEDINHIIPDSHQKAIDTMTAAWIGQATHNNDLDSLAQNLYVLIKTAISQAISSGHISENIQDVRWIPFDFTTSVTRQVKIGQYDTTLLATPLDLRYRITSPATAPSVPIPWQANDWRRCDPYHQIYVRIPYVGLVSFPASSLIGATNITMRYSLDKVSGDFACELIAGNNMLGTYGASTAVKIPIGNSSMNVGAIMNSFASLGLTALGGPATFAAGLANTAMSFFQPLTQTVGGVSSAADAGLDNKLRCISVFHDTTVPPSSVSSVMGTPAMATKQIGSLSGYIQCQGASVSGNMRAEDRDEINGYLNGGFFYT